MRRRVGPAPAGIALLIFSLLGPAGWIAAGEREAPAPQRIVALAPSLTETLFALGAGGRVVGVPEFCHFPPAAQKLPKIGGYYDPNYEAILALHPDLVVLLPENREHRARLQSLGLATLTVEQHSLAGVIASFPQLGAITGHEAEGARLAEALRTAVRRTRALTAALPRRKALLVLGRDYGPGPVRELYVVGRGEIYDQVLAAAGGVNAYSRSTPSYPKISPEGLMALKPDVILDIVPDAIAARTSPDRLRRDWAGLPGLGSARIEILVGDYLTIPGPRLIQTLRAFVRALHPEVQWE